MKRENFGFTIVELLIVVAIIAALVAIAIPIFTAQLDWSKDAADLANTRAAYEDVFAKLLYAAPDDDGNVVAISSDLVKTSGGPHTYEGWVDGALTIGGISIPAPTSADGQYLQLALAPDGTVSAAWVDP